MTKASLLLLLLLPALALVLTGCRGLGSLFPTPWECPTSCYDGPAGTEGVGACRSGVPICDYDAGTVTSCPGEVLPKQEVCNGIDDNCDGVVDVGATGVGQPCYDGPAGTEDVGICYGGVLTCEGVRGLVCIDEQLPEPETCNGRDNNCDGLVGNDIQWDGGPFCYTGPASTIGVGACRPGWWACDGGTAFCNGEQGPEPDLCDGVDRQCDGHPLQTQGPVDIVFLLENTDIGCEDALGATKFFQAQQTMLTFMTNHGSQTNFHYGVVTLPGCPWPGADDAGFTLLVPTFSPETWAYGPAGNSCLIEPSTSPACVDGEPVYLWDVIYEQAQGQLVPWEPGARRAIVAFLGDEGESNGACPGASTCGILEVQRALQASEALFVAFIANGFQSDYTFGGVPGIVQAMTSEGAMGSVLDQELVFPCTPDAGTLTVPTGDGGTIDCTCVGSTPYCPCLVNGVWQVCTPPFTPLPNPCIADGG